MDLVVGEASPILNIDSDPSIEVMMLDVGTDRFRRSM